jgi:glycosyltransferase involved in cell wall biosynthesis
MSASKPRVLVFSREYPPVTVGGTSTVARNLAVGLTAHGWQATVLSTNPGTADHREETDGVTVQRVATAQVYEGTTQLADPSLRTHRGLHRLAEQAAAEEGPPDLVALPDLFCYPEAAVFARRHEVPLLNILLQDFRAITPYDRGAHQVTWGVTADRDHLLSLERKALLGSDHTVFISHALASAVTGYYRDENAASSVIHLGVDEDEIRRVDGDPEPRRRRALLLGGSPSAPLLVACGRMVPVKGFEQLLNALALLGPEPAYVGSLPRLALVGIGPEEPALRRLSVRLGLDDRVTFLGDVPRAEALGWMAVADVNVVPSLWESFCYVCAEMMAFGRPVVASAVDSLRELIPDGRFGYPVPVSGPSGARRLDPRDLAHALRQALADPQDAARRGSAGRDRIAAEFTNSRFARNVSALAGELKRDEHHA